MGRHRVVDWSDLPPELLLEIGKRLKFRLDVLRFRSVCKSWRCSLFFKPKIEAFKIPEPPIIYDCIKQRDPPSSFILTERTMYSIHPKESEIQTGHGYYKSAFGFVNWASGKLAEFEELLPNKFLPHAFSSRSSIDGFFKVMNMLDFTISPITKFYGIVVLHNKEENVEERFVKFDRFQFLIGYDGVVDKVIIVSNYNYVSIIYPIPIDCDEEDKIDGKNVVVVAALLRGGKVGLLRLLGSELTPDPVGWRVINYGQDDEDIRFDDVVNLEGRLCVVDCKGRAFLVDLYSLELTQIAALPPPNCNLEGLQLLHRRRKRLVEHSGDLYLLVTCQYKVRGGLRPHILVYKLRVQTREWVEVVSLGDLALFVGFDFSFAATASNIFGNVECNRNCIFFVKHSFPDCNSRYQEEVMNPLFLESPYYRDVGIFDLPDGANFGLASCDRCDELTYHPSTCVIDRRRWRRLIAEFRHETVLATRISGLVECEGMKRL